MGTRPVLDLLGWEPRPVHRRVAIPTPTPRQTRKWSCWGPNLAAYVLLSWCLLNHHGQAATKLKAHLSCPHTLPGYHAPACPTPIFHTCHCRPRLPAPPLAGGGGVTGSPQTLACPVRRRTKVMRVNRSVFVVRNSNRGLQTGGILRAPWSILLPDGNPREGTCLS